MEKLWTNQIVDGQIAQLCAEYSKLFKRVKRHTRSNAMTWLVVQDLIRDYPPKRASDENYRRIDKDLLEQLHGLGVHRLKDLTIRQAEILIDCVKTERKYGEI